MSEVEATAQMSESEANKRIIEEISARLDLVTNTIGIMIAEGKLDPVDYLTTVERVLSAEFIQLSHQFKTDLTFQIVSKTVH
jgi:hypothetical protein